MSAELLQIISIIAFAISAIFFAITVRIYLKMDVKGIIDDLTGKMAARQIEEIRKQNRQSIDMRSHAEIAQFFAERKKITELSDDKKKYNGSMNETVFLEEGMATQGDDTDVIEDGTVLLEDETTLLEQENSEYIGALSNGFYLIVNEMIVHTNERI